MVVFKSHFMKSVSRYLTPWRVTMKPEGLGHALVTALWTLPCVTWKCESHLLGLADCEASREGLGALRNAWLTCWWQEFSFHLFPKLLTQEVQEKTLWSESCICSHTHFVPEPSFLRILSFRLGMQLWYLPHQYGFMRWCWFQHNLEWILLASRRDEPRWCPGPGFIHSGFILNDEVSKGRWNQYIAAKSEE